MAQPATSTQLDTFPAASSSSASSTSYGPFDVFINHRGPDVKNTFAGHLHRRFNSMGLRAFIDRSDLQTGHKFPCQIKDAIEVASVHIAIFSEGYAKSVWCLQELVLMLNSKGTILPVFYNVKPFELRLTTKGGKYSEALQKHEVDKRYKWETIQGWKKALSDVADISGFDLEACNRDEVELLDKVVERVLEVVPKPPLYVAKYKIGLHEKLEDFKRKITSELEEEERRVEAKVVGIAGLGGIGKSTLAREYFNRNRSTYSVSSFLADVRENVAKKPITDLQIKLIGDLKGIDNFKIQSREEGIEILKHSLKSCHALVMLDDVDHLDQLDAFLPIKHVLHPKSLILITSRNKHVLRSAQITDSSIYHLKGLDRPHSLELFCCHAFFQPHPLPQFEDLVDGFVKACDGLPLSLQVFGALLCQENDRSYWEEQLNELQTLPPEIEGRLKISYNSLNKQEKQIFLDVACFCIGDDKDKWIRIWGGSRWKGSVGLRNLENKCLVEVDAQNKMRMHDHLRDMGRNIADDPSMPRRIWGKTMNDVCDLLEQSLSSKIEVRGIKMPLRVKYTWEELRRITNADDVFRRISKLELLEAEHVFVEVILSKVRSPNLNLLWLSWYGCPCSSLPSWIPMGDLRVLEVRGSSLKRLWQPESQPPLQLRELHVRARTQHLKRPNSLSQLQHLEKYKFICDPEEKLRVAELVSTAAIHYIKGAIAISEKQKM